MPLRISCTSKENGDFIVKATATTLLEFLRKKGSMRLVKEDRKDLDEMEMTFRLECDEGGQGEPGASSQGDDTDDMGLDAA